MSKNWHIPRRTFLRGLGTAIALPFLDSMIPATRAFAANPIANPALKPFPKRIAFCYVPNGKNMADWTPATAGADYALTPILQPLAAHRKDFNLITGLALNNANGLGDGGGDHARSAASFLTAAHPRKTAGANIRAGISVDQVAANQIGEQTRLPSLELSCDKGQEIGTCESGYSCAYQFNLSWKSETLPMRPEVDPKSVFARLFKPEVPGETSAAHAQRLAYDASVLDYVMDDARSLQSNLGTTDRRKVDEYLSAIRDIERRIQNSGQFDIPLANAGDEPLNIPDDYSYQQHIRLMYDLMTLAFQTDSTRISSFIVAHDGSNRPYPMIDVPDGHHDLSHHRNDPKKKALLAKINTFHTTQFAYFLDRLKSVKEGEGTLLDNCMIVYGSAISDGNEHLHTNLPIILAGGGGGTLKPGAHIKVADQTPMANLYLSLLNKMEVPAQKFGDSTAPLAVV